MHISQFFDSVVRDLRQTLRGLQRRFLFTFAAILTLALGIGATTAVFSVVNAVVIKPLPYPDSDRIMTVTHSATFGNERADSFPFSPQMLSIYVANTQAFEELGMYRPGQAVIGGDRDPVRANTLLLTAGTLRILDVQPTLGRRFSSEDDSPGAPETVILTNEFWQREFGADPDVIGRTITIDAQPREVIGVMPARFDLLTTPTDVILPMQWNLATPAPDFCCSAVGKLRPGVTVSDANEDIDRLLPEYLDRYMRPASGAQADALNLRGAVRPLKDDVIGDIGQVLWVLLGSISILLLIACANVANLLLVRAETRGTELAVRTALGAGTGRLARTLLMESVTLSLIGGLVGIAFAYAGLQLLLVYPPTNLPRLNEIVIDLPVLGFALGVSFVAGLLFGLVPIFRTVRQQFSNLAQFVSAGGRWASASKGQFRSQNALVVIQVALALVLLVSSGLMIRTFQNLRSVEPGFTDPETVQTARLPLPENMPLDEMVRLEERILQELSAIPGVQSAAYATSLPMEGSNSSIVFPESETFEAGELPPTRRIVGISPGLLQTVGTPLLAGRDYEWVELFEQRNVAMVSESFARETWGSVEDALGQRVRVGTDGTWQDVIAVVADVYHDGVDQPPAPTLYWPARDHFFVAGGLFVPNAVAFALRTDRANSESLVAEIRRVVAEAAPGLPLIQVGTLDQVYRGHPSMARSSFSLALLGIAGAMSLILSIVGIYGVLAYAVMQRRREVGIRVALGAEPQFVRRMFVHRGMALATTGIVIGALAAVGLTRLLSSLLFGVTPMDAPTFVFAAVLLAMATLLASYLPARRAATIDPMDALRSE